MEDAKSEIKIQMPLFVFFLSNIDALILETLFAHAFISKCVVLQFAAPKHHYYEQ